MEAVWQKFLVNIIIIVITNNSIIVHTNISLYFDMGTVTVVNA